MRIRPESTMSTKQNPGAYDCYAKLADDEPYFVLRAKDPDAPALVEEWAARRSRRPGNEQNPKIHEALECAHAMRLWRDAHNAGLDLRLCTCTVVTGGHVASSKDCPVHAERL
jgi:hypothetical protein